MLHNLFFKFSRFFNAAQFDFLGFIIDFLTLYKLLPPGGREEEADRDRGAGDQEEGEGVDSHGKICCIWEVSKL